MTATGAETEGQIFSYRRDFLPSRQRPHWGQASRELIIDRMARWLVLFFALTLSGAPVVASSVDDARSVFAAQDPQGRLPNTVVRKLGTVKVITSTYSIFYLEFVNPVSRHGQQRIAIIKNGTSFAGAYQCTLSPNDARLILGKDRLTLWVRGIEDPSVVRFDEHGPTRNQFFCGEG